MPVFCCLSWLKLHLSSLRVLASVCLFFLKSLPLGVASFWGHFRISEMTVFSTRCKNTRVCMLCFVTPGVLPGHRFEKLFRHFGSSDSLSGWRSCVRWAGLRFYSYSIGVLPKYGSESTSFVRFVLLRPSLS